MNVLILGSGGREHCLSWKISQSKILKNLYVAPGNAGTSQIATNIKISVNDFESISAFITENKIDMLIVGPEDPLVNGLRDFLESKGSHSSLLIIGPNKLGATLEGSKDFAKEFMLRHKIPTARYFSANSKNIEEAKDFLESLKAPYVLKADGLAAGKGVLILEDLDNAISELNNMLNGKFGDAGKTVVIEEYLDGIECSTFVLMDGSNYIILPEAKDYKRIGENNTGLNTGGMGAVSPVPFYSDDLAKKVESQIIIPTIEGLKKENIKYIGFVFFGLMIVDNNPYVIEYNVRMGDPETEVVIPRIKSDFLSLLKSAAESDLGGKTVEIDERAASTVMLVSGGYPEDYEKHKLIKGLETQSNSIFFHAGTSQSEDKILSSGGRVIAVTSFGSTIFDALKTSYNSIENINFENMNFRSDIGFDLK